MPGVKISDVIINCHMFMFLTVVKNIFKCVSKTDAKNSFVVISADVFFNPTLI